MGQMAHPDKYTVTYASTSTGADVFYTPVMSGYIDAINYRPTATTPWLGTMLIKVSSTDLSVVALSSGVTLSTAGWMYYPRVSRATIAGATTNISERIPIVDQRLRVLVSGSTLAAMTGTFDFYVDGPGFRTT